MPSLDEPRSEKSDESDSDSDSDLDVLDVTVTRTIVNSEAEDKTGMYINESTHTSRKQFFGLSLTHPPKPSCKHYL